MTTLLRQDEAEDGSSGGAAEGAAPPLQVGPPFALRWVPQVGLGLRRDIRFVSTL